MAEAEVDRSLIKVVVLGVFGVLAAGFFAFRVSVFEVSTFNSELAITIVAALLWLSVLLLHVFFVKSSYVVWQTFLAQIAALIILLRGHFSPYLLGAGVLLFLCFAWGFTLGRSDLVHYVKVRFFKVGGRALPLFVTGVALFVAVYAIGILNAEKFAIPQKLFDMLLGSVSPVVARFVPGFSQDMTVDQALAAFVKSQLGDRTPESVVHTKVGELREALNQTLKITVRGDDSVKGSLYTNLLAKLALLSRARKTLSLLVIGFILFLTIKGFAFFFNWIVLTLAFLLYRLLQGAGFFYIGLEPEQKEIIVLK